MVHTVVGLICLFAWELPGIAYIRIKLEGNEMEDGIMVRVWNNWNTIWLRSQGVPVKRDFIMIGDFEWIQHSIIEILGIIQMND